MRKSACDELLLRSHTRVRSASQRDGGATTRRRAPVGKPPVPLQGHRKMPPCRWCIMRC